MHIEYQCMLPNLKLNIVNIILRQDPEVWPDSQRVSGHDDDDDDDDDAGDGDDDDDDDDARMMTICLGHSDLVISALIQSNFTSTGWFLSWLGL